MAKKKQLPEQLYIYIADVDRDGVVIYGVAQTLEEVPEDSGHLVGVYERVREAKLVVTRDLE